MAATQSDAPLLAQLEPRCLRQFIDPDFQGPKIYVDPKAFEEKISRYLRQNDPPLRKGFASFCHHLIVPNFAYLKKSYLRITPENQSQLRTKYDATTPQDIPVLTRYFPYENVRDHTPQAKYLDVILYTRAEIHQENLAKGMGHLNRDNDPPYGIMRVKAQVDRIDRIESMSYLCYLQPCYAIPLSQESIIDDATDRLVPLTLQDVEHELPMLPSTMLRNTLSKEAGGAGVPLDVEKYRESVGFWSVYASIQ